MDRTLPHNLEAEKCVLGAVLINNQAFNQAAEVVDANDFFRDAHRRIFEKMVGLTDRSEPVDLVTLKDELTRSGELEDVGGPAYISSLTDGVPRSANVEYYARIVKEKSTLRRLIQSATEVLSRAYDAEEDADDLLDEAERSIFQIAEHRLRAGFVKLSELVDSGYQLIEQLQAHRGLVTGVPSGFERLDEMTSGFQKSDLIIVAARPAMGKTSFVLNVMLHCGIEAGKTCGIFSLEMSKEQLFMRMLTSEARVDAHRFRGGFLGEQDYARLVDAFARLHDAKVFIDDSPAVGILEMRAKARRLKLEHGLDMLVVDYLQLMQGRGRFDNRQQELASISRSLKILAKELNIPIIALSQLSRAPETRGDHRPQLSDLRESGALEQDADVVMFIFREEMYAGRRREAAGVRRDRGDHRRQTAQRPDRHRAARVHQAIHALREPRRRRGRGIWGKAKAKGFCLLPFYGALHSDPSHNRHGRSRGDPEEPARDCRPAGARNPERAPRNQNQNRGGTAGTVGTVESGPSTAQGNLRAIATLLDRAERGNPGTERQDHRRRQSQRLRSRRGGRGPALEAAGASMLACADIEEGVALREAGVTIPILVFGALSVSDLDDVFARDLTPTVSTPWAARALADAAAARSGGCAVT